ncbi:PREDICTED: enhancer of split M1 protein [Rhagoletis zephyria]|uniref:enhancer of split M1 protein n=1 Tax=Rhagoletis zephyria TaxID=28612 RepID=UPI0008115131|nr:PREDICTED: enhancer of split M1 protein [Rhagoletis zephyria]
MLCYRKFLIFATLLICCAAVEDVQVEDLTDLEEPCPMVCPALYAPTCGFDGLDYQEFVNPCVLKVTNCERTKERSLLKKPFAQTDMDWCSTKLIGNIYDFLSKKNVTFNKSECLRACPMIYQPVCISNGKYRGTIPTACQLEELNCALKGTKLGSTLFKVLSAQKCEQD